MHNFKKGFLIFLLLLIAIATPSNSSAKELFNVEERLTNYLKEHEKDIAGLATIVINQDNTIYKMKGYSNIEKQIPIDEDTVFEWGSVSKILIWISVFQLVEKGKLDLETDIHTYLPQDFQSKARFENPITMRHLMNHSAGFDDSYTDLMLPSPAKITPLRDVLEQARVKQVFPPGDVVAYSNYGSGLATYIVERISGLDYQRYVRENILEPLRMTKTAIAPDLSDHQWVKEQRG